jgi:NAD(P)-dependent dehydrogenase (short-subunit alcohol dehydrogenase family)
VRAPRSKVCCFPSGSSCHRYGAAADPARVINIGSIAGIKPQVFPTFSYDVSKAAVHHLTRKLADELADRRGKGGHAITVNAIAPVRLRFW